MKDWIPFLQALIWPFFIGVILLWFRSTVFDILAAIKRRVEAGAEMEIGPSGFTLGSAPILKADKTKGIDFTKKDNEENRLLLSGSIYMVHSARFARMVPEGRDYEITVHVYAESSDVEDAIERVEYHLHKSYKRRVRESAEKNKNFELVLYAWGQFVLKAHVYLKGVKEPLVIWRFLNF